MRIGNIDITGIYVGSTPAAQMYFGDVKVWPEETPVLDVNAVKFENIGNTTGVVRLVHNESEALSDKADWEYSSDGSSWTTWDKTNKELSVDAGDSLYVRAGDTGQSRLASNDSFNRANKILPMSSRFKVSGPLSSLLSKNGTIPAGPTQYQFASLFLQGLALVDASELELPSTVAQYGYARTFGITGLSAAPVLPATTLNFGCYYFMFGQCTSLSTPPALPATTLAGSCYGYMFYNCTSLSTPPALPARTLASWCYAYMFQECTSLTAVPRLTMTNLNSSCYQSMFQGCTSLTSTGDLTANNLAQDCYSYMFADSGIVSAYFLNALPSELSGDQYTVFGKNSYCGGLTMFGGLDPSQVLVNYDINYSGHDLLSSFLPKAEEVQGVKFTNVDPYGNTATVQITDVGDASNNGGVCDLLYSTDGENWSVYNLEDVIYLQSQNDYVIFKANGPSGSGIKSVSDNSYYKFVVSQDNVLVEGDLAYLYSDDPENNYMDGDYQFAHLFDGCYFAIQYNSIYSSLKMPEETKWIVVGYRNVFSYIFANTTLARITIPVDSHGNTNGWNAYDAYSNWVYGISDGGQSGLMTLPSYFSIQYGESYIPYNWSYEN